jgi:GT2 family glycosyltransferase
MNAITTPVDTVAAVVVTFRPDLERLSALLDATLPQVEHVYIVDNGDGRMLRSLLPDLQRTSLIVLGGNCGIGAAQNAGARSAVGAGANYVLLLDQDSVPKPGMVKTLLSALKALGERGHRVAAVGPRAPSRENPGAFVTFGWFRYRKTASAETQPWSIRSGASAPQPVAIAWLACQLPCSSTVWVTEPFAFGGLAGSIFRRTIPCAITTLSETASWFADDPMPAGGGVPRTSGKLLGSY